MVTRVWLQEYGYKSMVTRVWLQEYGYKSMVTRVWLHTFLTAKILQVIFNFEE